MSKPTLSISTISRRQFVAGATAIIAASGAWSSLLRADELPPVEASDPTAMALKYVDDATKADPAVRGGEKFCHNCQLYSGAEGAERGPCSLFPGKAVSANGWCSGWSARSGG